MFFTFLITIGIHTAQPSVRCAQLSEQWLLQHQQCGSPAGATVSSFTVKPSLKTKRTAYIRWLDIQDFLLNGAKIRDNLVL